MSGAPALVALLRRVRRRTRIARASGGVVAGALVGFSLLGLAIATSALGHSGGARLVALAAGAAPLLGGLFALLRPVPAELAAQRIDAAAGLASRVATALEFLGRPTESRSAFMNAAIEDAEAHVSKVDVARVVPFERPRDLGAVAGLALLSLGATMLRIESEAPAPEPRAVLVPVAVDADALEAFEGSLDALRARGPVDAPTQRVVDAYNRLLTDIAEGRLDRTEALRRITALSRQLGDADREAGLRIAEGLADVGRRTGTGSQALTALSEAMRTGDAGTAERAMRELAERLRRDPPDRAELERMRDALRRAAGSDPSGAREQDLARRREEMDRLLRRQQQGSLGREEERLLDRRRRELERLERQQSDLDAQRRQLERLRRELDEAAEDLNRGASGDAANQLEQAAEELNRMAREQMSEEQRRELEEQMEQLREMIRRAREQGGQGDQARNEGQNGQGGGQGQGAMQRFVLRAQGQNGDGQRLRIVGPPGGQGGQGGGQGSQPGQPGGGQGGAGGRGGQGPAPGQNGETVLQLGGGGQGNAMLEVPGAGGSRPSGGSGAGTGAGPYGDERAQGSLDAPTETATNGQITRVEGEDGPGASRSQVILGAADRGFATRRYRQVYTDYSGHAEEVLERDEVPPGYRFYVRRYFQLIRPREDTNP